MCRPPSEQSVRTALGTVFPDVTIDRIQAIPSPRLQRLYEVTLSDGRIIYLVMSPSTRLRLLRSEHFMIPAEALAVQWIRNKLSKDPEVDLQPTEATSGPGTSLSLPQLVPSLIHLSHGTNELGSICSFFESTHGTPLALVPGLLSPEERQQIDGQVGQMFRGLAHLTSPTGRFGPVATCLSASTASSPRRGGGMIPAGPGGSSAMAGSTEGVGTWSGAFHLMLEGILRDGEDMAVMISYSAIRRHFKRLRHLLDLVTVPRLVVMDGADESNVLVSSSLPSPGPSNTSIPIPAIAQATSNIQLDSESKSGKDTAATASSGKDKEEKEDNSPMVFTGLRDWSTAIFGDPLIATIFSDSTPTSSFLQGFNNDNNTTTTSPDATASAAPSISANTLPLDSSIIEDTETAPIRQLLYQVYHASVSIVKEFYRPSPRESNDISTSSRSRRELDGRKKLTEALAKLELVQDHEVDLTHLAAKRTYGVSRLSGEMSPAKRVKEAGQGTSAGEE
ncbi:hypothetical protein V8F33_007161 [Rhypophila sp. PSN 637]